MLITAGDVQPDYIRDKLCAFVASEDVTFDLNLGAGVTGQRKPVVVVSPRDEQQASDVLRLSSEQHWHTLPLGGGTHMGAAGVPDTVDVALSTRHINRIIDYSPADMVVTAGAGVLLSDLQEELSKHQQMLPIDPVCQAQSTIGGSVAVGAGGPMQSHYGAIRDMTVGMRVVYPDGRMIKAGSKVVKNVAGYDMTKLFVGSYGTLAFLSEISFKLRPLPLYQTLLVASGSLEAGAEYLRRIVHSSLVPSRVEALSGPYTFIPAGNEEWHFAVDCHEDRLASEYQVNALNVMARDLGMVCVTYTAGATDEFWMQYHDYLRPSTLVVRYSVPPVNIMMVSQQIRVKMQALSAVSELSVSGPRGVGRLFAKDFSPDTELEVVQVIRQVVQEYEGVAVVERGSLELRSAIDEFGTERQDFRLMYGIKQTIDPQGIMSRGRLRGIEQWGKANLKS
ncbi:FAD-binding oxidoreductase [Alicyclobacillus sp. SO9]|uniref:FAD-binding oxidoreductase n=1 Tax=Alicyclobacillus sp. SO9 TaxID=2665646 RepID=UPI0018E7A1C2|nr:FAD-binding oxidoreductase [Alicyclobacillus sp. SO9]QQE77881.1 FAD-binding oxidoreductase [Alicyclobacillus sp. SO9]